MKLYLCLEPKNVWSSTMMASSPIYNNNRMHAALIGLPRKTTRPLPCWLSFVANLLDSRPGYLQVTCLLFSFPLDPGVCSPYAWDSLHGHPDPSNTLRGGFGALPNYTCWPRIRHEVARPSRAPRARVASGKRPNHASSCHQVGSRISTSISSASSYN